MGCMHCVGYYTVWQIMYYITYRVWWNHVTVTWLMCSSVPRLKGVVCQSCVSCIVQYHLWHHVQWLLNCTMWYEDIFINIFSVSRDVRSCHRARRSHVIVTWLMYRFVQCYRMWLSVHDLVKCVSQVPSSHTTSEYNVVWLVSGTKLHFTTLEMCVENRNQLCM